MVYHFVIILCFVKRSAALTSNELRFRSFFVPVLSSLFDYISWKKLICFHFKVLTSCSSKPEVCSYDIFDLSKFFRFVRVLSHKFIFCCFTWKFTQQLIYSKHNQDLLNFINPIIVSERLCRIDDYIDRSIFGNHIIQGPALKKHDSVHFTLCL